MKKGNRVKLVGKRAENKLLGIQLYPLTIVTAPMGYSKNAVVKRIIHKMDVAVEWFNAKNQIWQPKEHYEQPTIVVLENYHMMAEEQKYRQELMTIVQKAIEHLHIILITRTVPELPLEEWKVKHICQIVDCRDLGLTAEEIQSDLEASGIIIDSEEAQEIYRYVGGWPIIVELMRDNQLKYNNLYHTYTIHSILREGIYNKYSQEHKELLLKLAAISPFNLLGSAEAPDYFNLIKGVQRFVPEHLMLYDNHQETYGFIPIVQDFLLTELSFQPEKHQQEICSFIGEWYLTKKKWCEGFKYLMRSNNYSRIAQWLECDQLRHCTDCEKQTLVNLLDQIGDQIWKVYPMAYLRLVYYKLLNKNKAYAKMYLEKVEVAYQEELMLEKGLKDKVLGELYAIRAMVACERVDEKLEIFEKVESYIPNGSAIVNGLDLVNKRYLRLSYIYHTQVGKYRENMKALTEVFKKYAHLEGSFGTEMMYLTHAEYYMYTGGWEESKEYAFRLFYKADILQNYRLRMCSEFILARIALGEGKLDGCLKYMEEIEDYAAYDEQEELVNLREIGIRYLKSCLGGCLDEICEEKVREIFQLKEPYSIGISPYITYARSFLEKKAYIQFDILQDMVKEHFLQSDQIFGQIYYYIFEAIRWTHRKNEAQAKRCLLRAIELGKQDEIILPVIEHRFYLKELLEGLEGDADTENYIQRIQWHTEGLDQIGTQEEGGQVNPRKQWGLTEREWEIVELIRRGLTNKQIANELFVANITIAKTTSNIYRKMGVSNRIEMIGRLG